MLAEVAPEVDITSDREQRPPEGARTQEAFDFWKRRVRFVWERPHRVHAHPVPYAFDLPDDVVGKQQLRREGYKPQWIKMPFPLILWQPLKWWYRRLRITAARLLLTASHNRNHPC